MTIPEGTAPDPFEAEVDLREYGARLWRAKWLVAVLVALGGGLGWTASHYAPKQYVTTARVYVGDRVGTAIASQHMAYYQTLIASPEVAAKAAAALSRARPPYNLSAGRLQSALTVGIGTPDNIIVVTVRLPDATLAKKAADAIVAQASSATAKIEQNEKKTMGSSVDREYEESRQRVQDAREAVRMYERDHHVFERRTELRIVRQEIEQVAQTDADLRAETAALQTAEAQAADARGELKSAMQLEVASSRRRLAALKARREYLQSLQRGLPAELDSQFEMEAGLQDLKNIVASEELRHAPIAERHRTGTPATAVPALHRLDEAAIPDRPAGPSETLSIAVGSAAAFLAALLGIFLYMLFATPGAEPRRG